MIALLIRHGDTAAVGQVLWGRNAGLRLTTAGTTQARRLPRRLEHRRPSAIYASPRERAQDTARPLAAATRLAILEAAALDEVDFGEWSGRTIADLDTLPEWHRFNADRQHAQAPGGERLSEVQHRVVAELTRLESAHPAATIALVTHAELIRCAVLHYLGMPLDAYQRIEISPASITTLVLDGGTPRLLTVNELDRP